MRGPTGVRSRCLSVAMRSRKLLPMTWTKFVGGSPIRRRHSYVFADGSGGFLIAGEKIARDLFCFGREFSVPDRLPSAEWRTGG